MPPPIRALLLILPFWSIGSPAQKVNDFPTPQDPLHVRIEKYDALLHGNHWNEGTIMEQVILPPAGSATTFQGSQEDCCGHTANMLAAYSHRYATTKDPEHRKWADALMEGILKLEKVTGVPGVVARAFYKTEEPLWHEQQFFFPMEWHWSDTMPGYRWQGDLSSDKFVDLFYGLSTYYDLCADEEHKKIAADFLDRFIGRVVDHNFRMVDIDNKQTLWGNFCPDLRRQPLNSLEMLAGLLAVHHMTGKDRYRMAYEMLIRRYHYDDDMLLAKVLWPERWKTPWDDGLAAMSLAVALRYETDPSLLNKYRMCLNRHWYDWKDHYSNHHVGFHLLYQVLTGEEVMNEKLEKAIKGMYAPVRDKRTYTIPSPEGPKRVESEKEEVVTGIHEAYWYGRYHGLIDPEW